MLEHSFADSIFRFFYASESTLHKLMENTKPDNLTNIHYKIMEYLYFNDGTDISSLADCLYLSLPNTSREIKKLIASDYVYKSVDPQDKRRFFIHLSDSGKTIIHDVLEKAMVNATKMYAHLDAKAQEELTQCIHKVINGFLIADQLNKKPVSE